MTSFGKLTKTAALAGAVAMTLAACSSEEEGGNSTGDGGGDGRGNITFAMGSNDTDKLTPVIEAWNADHPDEQVELVELPAEQDGQRETLVQSLQAGGTDYDVFALDVTDTAQFAANGWLEPIEGEGAPDLSGLLDAPVESATYNDTVFAVPQNTNAQLLYYRTDLVDAAPANWDELTEACSAAEEADVDCLDMQLSQYEGLSVAATQFMQGWGGTVVGEDGTTPTLDDPNSVEGFTALVDGYKNDVIAQRSDSFTEEETAQAFLAGETLFSYNWPYMYDSAKTEESSTVADNFDVAPIVGKDGAGASTLGGYNDAINVNSPNKATAKDFLSYVISEEVQRGFADQSFPPVLASIYDDEAVQEEYPYMEALKAALDNAQPRPVTPFYPGVSKAIQDNTWAAIKDEAPVDQALSNMSDAITQATG